MVLSVASGCAAIISLVTPAAAAPLLAAAAAAPTAAAPILVAALIHSYIMTSMTSESFIFYCLLILTLLFHSDFVATCVTLAKENSQGSTSFDGDLYQLSLDDDSMSNASSPPYSVSPAEAKLYYSGLFSSPTLVYRTSAETRPWTMPMAPEAYCQMTELRPVFGHKVNAIWATDLGPKVCGLLDSQGIYWTSIDVVRFIRSGETVGPVVLWIGVAAESLPAEEAHASAKACLNLLEEFDIIDIEVEFRESSYSTSAGPNLLQPASNLDADVDVRGPLTPTLGLPIALQEATRDDEGTGGLYLAKGGNSKTILLLTARHVLFPPNLDPNTPYSRSNTKAARRRVLLLGRRAFDNFLDSIKIRIGEHSILVDYRSEIMKDLEARVDGNDEADAEVAARELEEVQGRLDGATEAIEGLQRLYSQSKKGWSNPGQRVLGHVVYSPPLTPGAGTEGFTEDYALVKLDIPKMKDAFKGNVIDLGVF